MSTRLVGMLAGAVAPLVIGAAALAQETAQGAGGDAVLVRGLYLATIMDCGGCHARTAFTGQPPSPDLMLAGAAVGFHLPGLGYFYPPNLTPDPATGLGTWSEDDIVRAVRTGARPDGRILAPVMPYPAYAALTDEDAYALAAFLKSVPPVAYPEEPPPTGDGETPPAPYQDVILP